MPQPDEPIERVLEDLMNGRETSRREFVGKLAAAGFLATGASSVLAACGGIEGEGERQAPTRTPAAVNHPKVPIERLNFANWPLYIDKKVLKDFEREFGGRVKYTEEINANDEFFGKIRQPLAQGRSIGRDLIVLTDWMAARLVRLGYLERIDKKNVPNARNLQPTLRSPGWDRKREFSLPWQSGMTAIGYNREKAGRELNSLNDLFDPAFKGRVSMLSDARDSVNLVLLAQGIKPADAKIDDILEAIEKIDEENRKGQIRRFTGNDYTTDLAKGNLWVSVAYSGDIIQLQADNPNLEFLIPDEGATLWSDNMLVPKKAEHIYAAETMMNFVYEPEVAAKIAAYVNYVTPVVGAKEVLARTDRKAADNELIFPSEETLARLHPYPELTEDEERQMNEAMQAVVGA